MRPRRPRPAAPPTWAAWAAAWAGWTSDPEVQPALEADTEEGGPETGPPFFWSIHDLERTEPWPQLAQGPCRRDTSAAPSRRVCGCCNRRKRLTLRQPNWRESVAAGRS